MLGEVPPGRPESLVGGRNEATTGEGEEEEAGNVGLWDICIFRIWQKGQGVIACTQRTRRLEELPFYQQKSAIKPFLGPISESLLSSSRTYPGPTPGTPGRESHPRDYATLPGRTLGPPPL